MENSIVKLSALLSDFELAGRAALIEGSNAWSNVAANAQAEPFIAAMLVSLAALTGLAARQLVLLLAALLLTAFTLSLISMPVPLPKAFVVSAGVVAQLLLFLGSMAHRRRIAALQRRATELEIEKEELKDLLDREVLWRTAAEK